MACAGEESPLPDELIAKRASVLCAAAESCSLEVKPVYVIGTEVPTPGGAMEALTSVAITSLESTEHALEAHREAFLAAGLTDAWERVIALVVQPGVEFGNDNVVDYKPEKAQHLSVLLRDHPGLVFEAHSTDYQLGRAYRELVQDGFAILKVGPELTFAMRQALFSLSRIEEECIPLEERSHLPQVLEAVMLRTPEQWQKHYHGTPEEQSYLRLHSYSDRIRYFWQYPEVKDAVRKLMKNLEGHAISESMLSDYMPEQYRKVRAGRLVNQPLPIVLDKISEILEAYAGACAAV
jgi:D-tagatose-1,6-bisphosphate aldolase subunit GatZ/KbaZ